MINRLLISGVGGQGALMIGKLICECAVELDTKVTFFPLYGYQKRGGDVSCTVIQSDDIIGSPYASKLEVLCALTQQALDNNISKVVPGGIVLANSSLIDTSIITRTDVKIVPVDIDNLAFAMGNERAANVIMFGAYVAASKTLPIDRAREIMLKKLGKRPELAEINGKAFDEGVKIAQSMY